MVRAGVERLTEQHTLDVVGLLDQLGPMPMRVRNPEALRANRRELSLRVIARFRSPERLGRWLTRVAQRFGVANLAGYLRRSSERGDPGTVLEGGMHGRIGCGTETEIDFDREHEDALLGAHADDVAQLVARGAATHPEVSSDTNRGRLRVQLAKVLHASGLAAARRVLIQLVGADRSDAAVARAVEGIMPLAAARKLLAA